jgi:hypothetical protein
MLVVRKAMKKFFVATFTAEATFFLVRAASPVECLF